MTVLGIVVFLAAPAVLVGLVVRWIAIEYRRDRVPILLYHRLIAQAEADRGDVPDEEMIWVSYDTAFAAQMDHLQQAGYTTLDLDDYVAIRAGRAPRPDKPVIVTFDDGYESNYRYALPVLKRNGQKAVIFVAPEPDEHTRRQVEGVDGFLSVEQIRELADSGISIQSHTLTHCILTELDDAQVAHELAESRRRIEAMTGRPVRHFAVPRAGYSRRVRRLVQEAGYLTACCNNKGSANGSSDPLALPRIVIERDMTADDFARALTPRTGAMLRIVGNLKRIPERLGGPRFAARVRRALYRGPLRPLFATRNLKRVMAALGCAYLLAGVWFLWRLLRS